MRRVYSGRFQSIPVYQRISPFLPIESTINALRAYSIYLHRIPPATDSEPVSLGSNPSSPVFISRFSLTRRGAFGTGAGLSRERCRPLAEAQPPFGESVAGLWIVPLAVGNSVPAWFRGRIAFFSHAPRGFRHSGAGLPRERGGGVRPARISRRSAIFLVFRHAGGQRDSFLLTCKDLVDCSHSGAINASGGASRGARKTTSAPPSSRA